MKIRLKLFVLALVAMLVLPSTARADEGMWLLSLIGKNYTDMQKQGFKLTPEDVYSINQASLKDAIVGLGNAGSPFWHFCTGEIISDQGLMSTNHHCGYGKIQEHSTVGHDYLRDGFWAYSKDQELPNPGLTASILVRMEDVTDRVKASLNDNMSESDREDACAKVFAEIEKAAVEGTQYAAKVRPMFDGNQFFLFVHIIYRDVRLVGAPPSSMGKFGGDTDNWSWPRHTCDFSMFRIYTAPDGSPADYSANNVPLKPKHFLPVSIKELKDGDFAMVMGFPGTTTHTLTSFGLEETMKENDLRYAIRTVKINVLREQMNSDQAIRIKYASKYASCSNYWKYSVEQNKALKNLNTMGLKKDLEQEYLTWSLDKDPKYKKALDLLRDGYAGRAKTQADMTYLTEGLLTGPELPWQSYRMGRSLIQALGIEDIDKKEARLKALQASAANFYKDYDMNTEKMLEIAMYQYVCANMTYDNCPKVLSEAYTRGKGDMTKFVDGMFAKSIFANAETFNAFMKKPNARTIEKDPIYQLGEAIYDSYITLYQSVPAEVEDNVTRGQRDFTDGILQINAKKHILMSPDANSTIRLTYGNVKAYDPRDAVSYSHYTTLKGVIEKEQPEGEFEVPARLKELYNSKTFGRYANSKGELPTCFITNNDITGGNSGSPVIDAEGNLIGLAFDGNGEAMSGDIDFEENLQRCICLDARYMLWVIDVYAGAHNLIEEMKIVQ